MNSLLEMYAYGMSTSRQIEEFQRGNKVIKSKSVRKSPLKDLKPVFEITENDLP
jgi:hypothetical protein